MTKKNTYIAVNKHRNILSKNMCEGLLAFAKAQCITGIT